MAFAPDGATGNDDDVYFNTVLQQEGSEAVPERYIKSYQMHQLSNKLEHLKISLNNDFMEVAIKSNLPLLMSVNLLSGFGSCQVAQVNENAAKIFSLSNGYQYVDIWHPDVAVEILLVLNVVFGDIDYQFNDTEQEEDSFALQAFDLWDCEVVHSDLLLISSDFYTAEDMHGYLEEQEESL